MTHLEHGNSRRIDHDGKRPGAAIFCVFVVAIAFLGSIAKIRYVTLDDSWYAAWVWNQSWVRSAFDFAIQQGRLLKPSSFTYYLPYQNDGVVWNLLIRLGPIVAASFIAGIVLQKASQSVGVALLFVLLFFAFAQNSHEHNLFVAYPFAWEFSWLCWMLGLLGLMIAIERKSMIFALAGTVVWLFGLQEGFVPHTIIFIAAALAMSDRRIGLRYLAPYLCGLAIWLGLWLWWRAGHPSTYEGSKIDLTGSRFDVLHSLINYSVGGMPFATLLYGGATVSLTKIFASLDAISLIKSLAVFLGVLWLLTSSTASPVISRLKPFGALVACLISLIFLPNLVLALTPKYQEWTKFGVHAYLYSHFSYFAWTGLGTIGLFAIHQQWSYRPVTVALALLAALGSIVTDASNRVVNKEQELFGLRWNSVFMFLASEEFQEIPVGSTILFSDRSLTGAEASDAYYWNYVLNARGGKALYLTSDPEALVGYSKNNYYLYLYDEPRSANRYILFSKLDSVSDSRHFTSDALFIYPDTENERMQVGGRLSCTVQPCLASATANGRASAELFESSFVISAGFQPDSKGVSFAKIETSAGVDPRSVWVDFARNKKSADAPVRISAASGFRGWEASGGTSFNWSNVDSELELLNRSSTDIWVDVEFWLVGGDTRDVLVFAADGAELEKIHFDGNNPAFARIPILARRGVTSIGLKSVQPPLYGQGRSGIAYQLHDLGISISSDRLLNGNFE